MARIGGEAMSDKPKLAEVKTAYDTNFRNIPETLRLIAKQIEQGEFGECRQVVLVAASDVIDVCHMGEGTAANAALLLQCGLHRLVEVTLNNLKG